MPLAMILLLALALGDVVDALGTGVYVAQVTAGTMPNFIYLPLAPFVAASLAGGVFGDHCSPISDTTIISSMAAATDHIDHVRTQLPYALLSGAIATICFGLLGATL